MATDISMVTCLAPVNIALIKYWGKRNEEIILPMAGSISVTLNTEQVDLHIESHQNKIKGEQSMDNPRIIACLTEIRKRASFQKNEGLDAEKDSYHVHICSTNNFPTAAGLASSAAGYACLAPVSGYEPWICGRGRLGWYCHSICLTRPWRGSGSACRSVLGGFVEWVRGELEDGSDSLARQIAPSTHWPELHIFVLVVNDQPKTVGSSEAMRRGVDTSDFLHYWANQCVPKQIPLLKAAILNKDFPTLADMTMKASNQLHAVCLDGFPPVAYMNDVSHAIVSLVHGYNSVIGRTGLAYTFDAGPNACLLLQSQDVPMVSGLLRYYFSPTAENKSIFFRGQSAEQPNTNELDTLIEQMKLKRLPGSLKYILCTKLGDEPIEANDHLLNEAGYPIAQ